MPPSGTYPKPAYAWLVVAILITTAILSYTDRQVLSLLVDPIRSDLGLSDIQMSLLLGAAFAIVYGVAGVPLGYLADRTSRRNLIFAGVVVWSVGTIACGASHSFNQIFAGRIVVGVGEAVLAPSAISLISDYFPPARRGTAVGFFLSGIAMGQGVAILIGGGVLNAIENGVFAGTAIANLPAWRTLLFATGGPGLLWALAILLIREAARPATNAATTAVESVRATSWLVVAPIYLMLAAASTVDNAMGAWAPSLLIRNFGKDPAQIGVELGLLLTVGFGGGVLIGGMLADRAGMRGGWRSKLRVCLYVGLLILPASLLMNSTNFIFVLCCIPLYFALSGIVTAIGFSTILDTVPSHSRGLAMSISFFLNVAFGAGLGPTAVTLAGAHLFGASAGLGPPIVFTVVTGYAVAIASVGAAFLTSRVSATRPRAQESITS